MKRKVTITYEIETSRGGCLNPDRIAHLIHNGLAGTMSGVTYTVRDATLSIESIEDCSVHTAAVEANAKKCTDG